MPWNEKFKLKKKSFRNDWNWIKFDIWSKDSYHLIKFVLQGCKFPISICTDQSLWCGQYSKYSKCTWKLKQKTVPAEILMDMMTFSKVAKDIHEIPTEKNRHTSMWKLVP